MGTGGKNRHLISSLIYPSIFCFIVLGINSHLGDAGSETRHFYYYYSEKIYLDMSTEKVAICFKETTAEQDRRALITTDPTFEGFSEEALPSGLTLALTKPGLSKEDIGRAVERLNGLAEVKYSTPVFEYKGLKLVLMDQFVVRFNPSITEEEIATLNQKHGVGIVRISPYRHNRYVLRVMNPKDITALEMANIYNEDRRAKYGSPGFAVLNAYCSTEPNDTYFDQQWGLHNIGQDPPGGTAGADMNAPEGWDMTTGSSEIIIAIIDSGIDIVHEDLAAKIWVNTGEIPDNQFDDDGNHYPDDVYGWDFVDEDSDGDNGPDNNPRPNTDAHGTLCAGLAAAVTNNGEGVAGVSWSSKIMALRIGGSLAYLTTIAAEAIDYAAANGADVLSNSWNTASDADLTDAIVEAKNNGRDGKGCVIVCSSGNIPRPAGVHYPASLDETIAVGATDENDVRWSYSNSGPELTVVAPSGDGVSTIFWTTDISGSAGWNPGEDEDDGDANGDYAKWFRGTSAATPQVAGLAALILSVKSSLRSDEVQFIIESTADDLGASGRDDYYGWGRINVERALTMASDYPLFRVEDSDGRPVADFDAYGNLFLAGRVLEIGIGGIEAHWELDETSGQTAYDSVGSNDGTLSGCQWTYDEDREEWDLDFDGTDDYVSLSATEALKGDAATVSAWIKADSPGDDYGPIFTQYYYSGGSYDGYGLYLVSGEPCFRLDNDVAEVGCTVTSGEWHHLAGTYDGETLRVYLDADENETSATGSGRDIGAYMGYGIDDGEDAYFDGIMDDVRVYDYALSYKELLDLSQIEDDIVFTVQDGEGEAVAWFDASGYLFLKGSVQDTWADPSAENDNFIITDGSGDAVAYIDDSGNLYLAGKLYE